MIDPAFLPFLIALAIMLGLVVMQLLPVIGAADIDHDVADGGLWGLLGLGRVPLMLWLALLAFFFAALGASLQAWLRARDLPALATGWATMAGFALGLPATVLVSRWIGPWLPHDESDAVSREALLGKRAVISVGTATAGSPARASVRDAAGTLHLVLVEPHAPGVVLQTGDCVLLVRAEGDLFFGLNDDDRQLGALG